MSNTSKDNPNWLKQFVDEENVDWDAGIAEDAAPKPSDVKDKSKTITSRPSNDDLEWTDIDNTAMSDEDFLLISLENQLQSNVTTVVASKEPG